MYGSPNFDSSSYYPGSGEIVAKKIIFIHGRAVKPSESDLRSLWFDAVIHGLQRDYGEAAAERFNATAKEFVYYGDLFNDFLHETQGPEVSSDIAGRQDALETLKRYKKPDFNRAVYNRLASMAFWKEALADIFSGVLSIIRAGTPLISVAVPDMAHYWDQESSLGKDVHLRLSEVLKEAFDNGDEIMLVAHSLGTIISYDNLWKFSHHEAYSSDYGQSKKIDLFVTLGSPLGDENAKQHLQGRVNRGRPKYPHNIKRWVNLSAEDDYVSHDNKIQNDFHEMYKEGLLEEPLRDIYPLYNLTVQNEKPNPHSAIGYLVNPEFIEVLNSWIS